ncbi:MAG: YbfB/YjiJ family MFS transporter [Pseudomonadota bacterium]
MTAAERRRIWWIIIGISLGPAVTNGFARFAYGLILPAMQDDLAWNFTQAGWINTANAIGYLIGSVLALATISRLGPRRLFVWGMALTALALAFSALTRDLWILSFWRVMAGIGGAPVFIAGGAMASALFAGDRRRNALAIAVYFGGGGLGMLLTGISLPLFMDWFGDAGWPLAWLALGIGSYIAFVASFAAAEAAPEPEQPEGEGGRMPAWRMVPVFWAYFLFGVGYIVYITFLIAWMQARGDGPMMVAGTWALMGIAVMASPFIWAPVLARSQAGGALSLTSLATGTGILLPVLVPQTPAVLISAAMVGGSFFMIPTSVTNFCRKNLTAGQWGPAISLLTVIFSVGQIIGPVGAGAIADWVGTTAVSLAVGGMVLICGALVALAQKPLMHPEPPDVRG